MRDVKRQWKRIRQDVNIELRTAANPDRTEELKKQVSDVRPPRMLVLDEMRKTGAKPFDVRLHDYRRTFGSWSAIGGESLSIIGSALNHADASTTQIYARLNQDVKRNAFVMHEGALMAIVNGDPAADGIAEVYRP